MEKFIKETIKEAGTILLEGYKTGVDFTSKNHPWEMVTEYDKKVEEFLTQKINSAYPGDEVVGEENGVQGSSNKKWIIDPIDGTLSFVRGFAQFSITIAYVEDDVLKIGAVYDPVHDELFFATEDSQATLNDKLIKPLNDSELRGASMSVMMETSRATIEEKKKIMNVIATSEIWTSTVQSGALSGCYVASGRFSIYSTKGLMPWDIAAASLIAKQAGAKVTDFDGSEYKWNSDGVIIANEVLHNKFLKELKK